MGGCFIDLGLGWAHVELRGGFVGREMRWRGWWDGVEMG